MATDRKVFPVEKLLELVTGKKNSDIKEISGFVLGRTIDNEESAAAAAPFAFAWLARWYPRFMEMEWKEDQNWPSFVKQAEYVLGNNVSLTPMSGRLKDMADKALNSLEEARQSLATQTEAAVQLEKKVAEYVPYEARSIAAQKKCDELEAKVKEMKKENIALQRKISEFTGKLAIDHDSLMQNIKDAIKDGLKGLSIGTVVSETISEAVSSNASPLSETEEDEFGFGSSQKDDDGFGF